MNKKADIHQHPYTNQNFNFNHLAIAVTSVDEVAEWYSKHFGFRRLNSADMEADRQQDPEHPIYRIYGDKLNKVKIAFLTTGNGVGFEIFEFIDPPTKASNMETWTLEEQYRRGGYFHIGVTVPDVDAKCEEVCKEGAKKIGEKVTGFDGEKTLFFRDPWGSAVELVSCSWEQYMANRW